MRRAQQCRRFEGDSGQIGSLRHARADAHRLPRSGARLRAVDALCLAAAGRAVAGLGATRRARAFRYAAPHHRRGAPHASAQLARIDGAAAGTPFFIALVPGYLSYLWQEGRMGLRIAALYGHDPAELRTAAEMLALRGVHPTADEAAEALTASRAAPPPEKPAARRPLRAWIDSVHRLLIFGGFLSAPAEEPAGDEPPKGGRLRALAGLAVAGAIWLTTWVLPVTFMIAMAWACESHTRQLGRRALLLYDGDAATPEAAIAAADEGHDRGHDRRQILRTIAIG